jgi:hypothetical protein
MSTLIGQQGPGNSSDGRGGEDGFGSAAGNVAGRGFFHLDLKRSLRLHWRLALGIAIIFFALAAAYFAVEVFVFKQWPLFVPQSINAVQPTPTNAVQGQGGTATERASQGDRTNDSARLQALSDERDRIGQSLAADHAEQDTLNKQLGGAAAGAAVPNHSNEDASAIRAELVKARADHDAAAAKYAAMGAGQAPSSAAIDAATDQIIASDAGLLSMKTALNARRATLMSQMANLTPADPQYKQNQDELYKINATLEAMMKDLSGKAAARIELHRKADLQRTAAVEARLSAQLSQIAGAPGSATPKMQRSSELAADIGRLQARYTEVDEQVHKLLLEDLAPAAAHQDSPAPPPLTGTRSSVLRNALLIVLAGLVLGVLSGVTAHKLDPKLYIAADVERVVGYAPMALLPDFGEVSDSVADEYVLRLASAIEHARKQGDLKNCIFTGTGSGAGVSTLVNRVRKMLEAMGRSTVLVDASGARPPAPAEESLALVAVDRLSRPNALLRQMSGETGSRTQSLVLADTAPLTISAETEYLARFVDCAIVVIQSGVTTRVQLRETAAALQRLGVVAVGFVLNRVGKAKADPLFLASVEAAQNHLQTLGIEPARRTEKRTMAVPEPAPAMEALPEDTQRARFEPKLAAVAAAVARFSSHPVPDPAVCHAAPMMNVPAAEAAKRFSIPLTAVPFAEQFPAEMPIAAEPQSTAEPVAESAKDVEPVEPVKTNGSLTSAPAEPVPSALQFPVETLVDAEPQSTAEPVVESAKSVEPLEVGKTNGSLTSAPADSPPAVSPFVEAARAFSETAAGMPEAASSRAVDFMLGSTPLPVGPEKTNGAPVNPRLKQGKWTEEAPKQQAAAPVVNSAASPAASPATPAAADVPWWLSDAPRIVEPIRPPVIWQPAKVSNSRERAQEAAGVQASNGPVPQGATPGSETAPPDNSSENMSSRLSELRNLQYVLDLKNAQGGVGQNVRAEAESDAAADRQDFQRASFDAEEQSERGAGGAWPRLVTAPPEFLPPKPVVFEIDEVDGAVGEYPTRQDPERHG